MSATLFFMGSITRPMTKSSLQLDVVHEAGHLTVLILLYQAGRINRLPLLGKVREIRESSFIYLRISTKVPRFTNGPMYAE